MIIVFETNLSVVQPQWGTDACFDPPPGKILFH